LSARLDLRFALVLAALAACCAVLGWLGSGDAARAAGGGTCQGKRATIASAAKRIVGTKNADTIVVKGGGAHVVSGLGGADRICGGPGEDEIDGGKGSDSIDGGGGDDTIVGYKGADDLGGGAGDDFIDGEQGSDKIKGAGGADELLGGKGNDAVGGAAGDDAVDGGAGDDTPLDGGPGVDIVIGGAGIDRASGGPGDGDVVRGDGGKDELSGGPGIQDIVSFTSATRSGVVVSLGTNLAKGDGHDTLSEFEDVVGSPQGDTISGDAGPNRIDGGVGDDTLVEGGGGGEAFGGPGSDSCTGFAVQSSCGPEAAPPADATFAILNRGLDGSSLIVQGGPGADHLRIAGGGDSWVVGNDGRTVAGDGCAGAAGSTAVTCTGAGVALVVITGGGGDDSVTIDPGVPADVTVRINGGAGGDLLAGGNGDDVLEAGETFVNPTTGADILEGGGGSDALFADPGGDQLRGGAGNDLLVSSAQLCQAHSFDGGAGEDTVSYARSKEGVHVALGGTGGPPGCASLDQIVSDEGLEGSDGADVLIGDSHNNGMLGHLGADTMIGKGGNDFLDAGDGGRDTRIDCGPGGLDEAVVDGGDPRPISC
jgi:Ca2+-binding RTX toxin-like protein